LAFLTFLLVDSVFFSSMVNRSDPDNTRSLMFFENSNAEFRFSRALRLGETDVFGSRRKKTIYWMELEDVSVKTRLL